MMSDAPLPDAAGPVDPASFDDFFRAEYGDVVRLAWSLTGRRAIAEELAQDAFLAAHRKWATIRAYDNPGAWVRRVVINRSLSTLRRASTEAKGLLRLSRLRSEEAVEMTDDAADLWRAVRRLPRRQAEVLALYVVEDLSTDEIAKVLECGAETVRTHLRRARHALAEQLAERLDEPLQVTEGGGHVA